MASFQQTVRRCPGGNPGLIFNGEFHCFNNPGGFAGASAMSNPIQFLLGAVIGGLAYRWYKHRK